MSSGLRPRRLVAVLGTGTDVGKTYVAARLLGHLRRAGVTVAVRKPAQSFDPSDDPASLDASVLGSATAEDPETVCPRHRWYEIPMAPPMAADALGRPSFSIDELVAELSWPGVAGPAGIAGVAGKPVDIGLVETAGGVRSPIADDGDCLDLVAALTVDLVVLVADAGLGTINSVRLAADALCARIAATDSSMPPMPPMPPMPSPSVPTIIVLNRFDNTNDLHRRNRDWLSQRDGLTVLTSTEEDRLVGLVRGDL